MRIKQARKGDKEMSERKYSLENVIDGERLYILGEAGKELNPISLAVIEVMHSTGMVQLTKSNLGELHKRTCMLSILGICMIQMPQDDGTAVFRNPLRPELETHIGLKVQTERLTERKFHNKLIAQVKESAVDFANAEEAMLVTLAEEPSISKKELRLLNTDLWVPGDDE